MANKTLHPRRPNGRFAEGQSGIPAGRPKGSTTHASDLRRLEEAGLALATHTADVIAETAGLALTEIGRPDLVPLIDAVAEAAKDAVKVGQIGPSSIALLRVGYDDLQDSGQADQCLELEFACKVIGKHCR